MASEKNTGFHPQDSDWTKGRAKAVADAEAIARKDGWRGRAVLAEIEKEPRA